MDDDDKVASSKKTVVTPYSMHNVGRFTEILSSGKFLRALPDAYAGSNESVRLHEFSLTRDSVARTYGSKETSKLHFLIFFRRSVKPLFVC